MRRPTLSCALTAVMAFACACTEPCRFDADCSAEQGLSQCDATTGTCQPLERMVVAACGQDGDCAGGRVCVDDECRFAPSCQRFADDLALAYVASCDDGESAGGEAVVTMNGCQARLELDGALGAGLDVVLASIEARQADVATLTPASGTVDCSTGLWSAVASAAALNTCELPDGRTCRIGLVREGAGTPCFDDVSCSDGACALLVGSGADGVGVCQ